jgi:hypothetical protein
MWAKIVMLSFPPPFYHLAPHNILIIGPVFSRTNGSELALMMEAARTSETSVDIQLRTRQYIPEDSELRIRTR